MSTIEDCWPVCYDYGLIMLDAVTVSQSRLKEYSKHGMEITIQSLSGSLEECFAMLVPLSPAPTKELYLPTVSGWTVFFQNGIRGSDPALPMMQISRSLGVTTMRVCVSPGSAMHPMVIWEVFQPPHLGGDKNHRRRTIANGNDGGRWTFQETGRPFDFEDTDAYQKNEPAARFTAEMLESYLSHFAVQPLNDGIFADLALSNGALLSRSPHQHLPLISLVEAKSLER